LYQLLGGKIAEAVRMQGGGEGETAATCEGETAAT